MTNPTTERQAASKALVAFKHNIEPLKLLHLLDELIATLKNDPSIENTGMVLKALSRYETISIESGGEQRWLTAPARISMEVVDNSLIKRIAHLTKTGVWLDNQSERTHVNIPSAAALPIKVPMSGTIPGNVLEETVSSNSQWILLSLRVLRTIVKVEADNGPVGVFEKPYGVTNKNRLSDYLDSQGDNIKTMNNNLRVETLDSIVENAIYTVNA